MLSLSSHYRDVSNPCTRRARQLDHTQPGSGNSNEINETMKKLDTRFLATSSNVNERRSGSTPKRSELVAARKRLINLSNYYGTLKAHNHSSPESEDLLEPLANLCSSNNVYKTFAQLISDRQRCLEVKEASICFSISEMLQLIYIENTQNISGVCNGARELLEKHSLRDVILSCWTGLLNLLFSREHTPSGNANPSFGSNFSTYVSEGLCAPDHDSTNFSDQCFDGWTDLLQILKEADQLYIRIDMGGEVGSAKSIIDPSTALESVTLTLTDILCTSIQDRDDDIHCLLNLIVYDISLSYSPVQYNPILKGIRTLLLIDCRKDSIDDDTHYDLFAYPNIETFGLLNSTIPLALIKCLEDSTPPIVRTGVSTQYAYTGIKRLWFNESSICGDARSDEESLTRAKLALHYLLASVINLTLSHQLRDLCLPADLPLEAYEFLLDHGISGILFMNLSNLTMHKLNQPVSLAAYMPEQTKERANLEAFYTSCLQSNNTTVAEFLVSSSLEGLLTDPYPVFISGSEEQNRYLQALSLFSRKAAASTIHQDAYFPSQSVHQQPINSTAARCTSNTEFSADELMALDRRIPAKCGVLLCDALEPKVTLSIATSLSYLLIPYEVGKLDYFPTCLLMIETLVRLHTPSSQFSTDCHNCKSQVLCYTPFSHVTRIVDPNHEKLKFMRAILTSYASGPPEPEIGDPTNKALADLCLDTLEHCLKFREKDDLGFNCKSQGTESESGLTITLAAGPGSVHTVVALTLVTLLEMGFATAISIDLRACILLKSMHDSQNYLEKYLSQITLFPFIKKITLPADVTMLRLNNASRKFVVFDEDSNEKPFVTQAHGARRIFKR
ncbi:Hypothetical protein GLP15_58 [Giardia lamblia P15]|uniref:Uncharacterized protein n=1 Tax=Giardia intestinalis (strain P15) TaxID=658858 RepID=E1F0S2_GIAIA|nr:Hypothetical protein GLP15_58 [Giardia lamblia P15]